MTASSTRITSCSLYAGVIVDGTKIDWVTLYQAAHQDDAELRSAYLPIWEEALRRCPDAPRTDADIYRYRNDLPPYSWPVDPAANRDAIITRLSGSHDPDDRQKAKDMMAYDYHRAGMAGPRIDEGDLGSVGECDPLHDCGDC